jgi:hypothetical protein
MSKSSSLTARQRYWLEHLQVCAMRRQSLSSYAAAHALAVGSLYEAKSRLKRLGAWPVRALAPRFVRVEPLRGAPAPGTAAALCRVRLPNGVVVDTAGSDLGAVLSAAARLS